MNPSTLHQLWSLIGATHTTTLMTLDDSQLVDCLTQQLGNRCLLNGEEAERVSCYLRSKLSLMRDLAQTGQLGYA
ncbi:hypothetical protein IQ257_16205 [Coleofasciculus sp. LEGE 07092]|nr:hypothetical protein [Coleofasciculus sp. LEGE 07081]MBE9150016.1 hypothetical protein [Coleofasciculus sp. LEGE 07092]